MAGNYYPVSTGAYIEDGDLRLSLLTDRSVGGASLFSGSLELMLHRRLPSSLNETGADGRGLVIRSKHLVIVAPPSASADLQRPAELRHTFDPLLFFSALPADLSIQQWIEAYATNVTAINPYAGYVLVYTNR